MLKVFNEYIHDVGFYIFAQQGLSTLEFVKQKTTEFIGRVKSKTQAGKNSSEYTW